MWGRGKQVMKNSSLSDEPQKVIEIIVLKRPMGPSDKYGHKRILEKLNEWARCPKCNAFLVWKDEKNFICPKCGFEKPATPAPTYSDIEPIEDWIAKQRKRQNE